MRRTSLLLSCLLGLPPVGLAQTPARDTRAAKVGTATLAGTVVSDDVQARPVRHARVTCTAPELTAGVTAITDDRGRFVCARLPAGRYLVGVTRDAWIPAAYGAKSPMRPGTPIPLVDGQRADVVVRMMHGAVITGALLDESGQPAANAVVRAIRNVVQNGEPRFVTFGMTGTTDDRGVYRIYGLPPGDYLVGAAPRGGFPGPPPPEIRLTTDLDLHHATTASPQAPPPPERGVAFASTFFPGTPLSTQAAVVSVRAGEEHDGVDFALQLVATARVEGSVSLPDGGALPSSTQVTLLASGQTAFPGVPFDGMRSTRTASDGSFSFGGISPGQYTVLARSVVPPSASISGAAAPTGPQTMWASSEILVDGERVSGIALTLQPGLIVAGDVRFEGTNRNRPALTSIRVSPELVQPAAAVMMSPASATVDQAGRFRVTGLTPGRYRLTATFAGLGQPGGWMVRSAIVNGQDTLDVPCVLQQNQNISDAVITFTDRPGQLAGRLQNSAGGPAPDYTVVLFPAEPPLWTPKSRRIQAARPAVDGAFAFRNLPPGDYLLAAMDDVEDGEWFDPAYLQRIAAAAMKVTVAEGEQKTQDIRLRGGG